LSWYGSDGGFDEAYLYFMILTIILPFKGLSYIYGVVITTFSKEYTKLYIQILIALVSIGLNIIFVSQYGIIASCWISVFSEVLLFCCYYYFSYIYQKRLVC